MAPEQLVRAAGAEVRILLLSARSPLRLIVPAELQYCDLDMLPSDNLYAGFFTLLCLPTVLPYQKFIYFVSSLISAAGFLQVVCLLMLIHSGWR